MAVAAASADGPVEVEDGDGVAVGGQPVADGQARFPSHPRDDCDALLAHDTLLPGPRRRTDATARAWSAAEEALEPPLDVHHALGMSEQVEPVLLDGRHDLVGHGRGRQHPRLVPPGEIGGGRTAGQPERSGDPPGHDDRDADLAPGRSQIGVQRLQSASTPCLLTL